MGRSKPIWRGAFAQRVRFSTTISDLVAVLLVALLAVPAVEQLDTEGFASTAHRQLAAVTGYIRNPLSVFGQRSPGARGPGPLIQTKHHRQFKLARIARKPQEEVLANVRYPSPIPEYLNDLAPIAGPGFLENSLPGLGVNGGPPGSTPGIPSPIAPVITPNGPGHIGAVPEPDTWLMAIWGMAMVGFGLRAKQRHLAKGGVRLGFRALI